MCKFGRISTIKPENLASWSDKIFITFDIDWADDFVLNDTLELVEEAGVEATWFVTHKTRLLERLRNNNKYELGIHPNFNYLLDGDYRNGKNAREVIARNMDVVPEAKSVRSHSLTQSSRLCTIFKDAGLSHDVNQFLPHNVNIQLKPYYLGNGLCRVPYNWEDDVYCDYGMKDCISAVTELKGLRVFDFHPIHVFLNTESLSRYEYTRPFHNNPNQLIKNRYEGFGTRSRLIQLLKMNAQ